MRLSLLLSLLSSTSLAIPTTSLNPRAQDLEGLTTKKRADNTCFDTKRGQCIGRQVKPNLAYAAIVKVCRQLDCDESGPSSQNPVKGKVHGYSATLKLGAKCGGIKEWDVESCAGLFSEFINKRCQKQYKSADFNRKFLGVRL